MKPASHIPPTEGWTEVLFNNLKFLFISDTGTTPPESGIFGFMINFSAFLGAATMYTRYKIVEKQNQTSYFSTPVFNLVSLVLGLVGCIGMGIVANFQELAVPVVHDGGALLAFVCGVGYTLLQSIISYKSCPQWNSMSTCHVRMAISAVSCAAVVPMIACASLISITKLEWNPKEKDYVYHVVSAICEWTVAFGFIFYFLTFIHDFQGVTLRISTEINDDIWRKKNPMSVSERCRQFLEVVGRTDRVLMLPWVKCTWGTSRTWISLRIPNSCTISKGMFS